MTYKDLEIENQAFGNLSDTLLRNRMMKQQQADRAEAKSERQQAAAKAATERGQDVEFRERELQQRMKAEEDRAKAEDTALGIRQQNADTASDKNKTVWYYVSPSTRNVKILLGRRTKRKPTWNKSKRKAVKMEFRSPAKSLTASKT